MRPNVITNIVALYAMESNLHVGLARETAQHSWQLPAAFVTKDRSSLSSLEQTLSSTVGLRLSEAAYYHQLPTSEVTVNGEVLVCISYIALFAEQQWHKGTYQSASFALTNLPTLSEFDQHIIGAAHTYLQAASLRSDILAYLLPERFSLAAYQSLFQSVHETTVDRRNFHKKLLALDVFEYEQASKMYYKPSADLVEFKKPFYPPLKKKSQK